GPPKIADHHGAAKNVQRVQRGESEVNREIRAVRWNKGGQARDFRGGDVDRRTVTFVFLGFRLKSLSRFRVVMRVRMKDDVIEVFVLQGLGVPEVRTSLDVPGHAGAICLPDLVVGELVAILEGLDRKKAQRAEKCDRLVKTELSKITQLE